MITQELLDEFKIDAHEILDEIETILLGIENGIKIKDVLRDLKGHLHSLKGAAGMFEMYDIENWMHKLENMLDNEKQLNKLELDTFFYAIDISKSVLKGEKMQLPEYTSKKADPPKQDNSHHLVEQRQKKILYIGSIDTQCENLDKSLFQVNCLDQALPILKSKSVDLVVVSPEFSKGSALLTLQDIYCQYGMIQTILVNKRMGFLNLLHDCLYKVFSKEEECVEYLRNVENSIFDLPEAG